MFRSIEKEGWSDDSMLRVSSQANQSNLYNNINPSSLHHSLVGRSSSGYSINSTPSGLTSSMSSPSLQSLGQSRQTSQLYGGSNGTNLSNSSLSTGRLNQFSSGLQSNTSSNLGLSNTRGLNQASSLTNGFLGHQTNQTSNLNSKFSSGIGNNISSNFGNNSLSSNFGNNLMNIFGSGSTSPSSAGTFGSSVSTQGSSHLFGSGSNNVQPSSSHLFGSALSSNSTPFTSQFNNISNNNSYSSFGGVNTAFSPSLDLTNSATESLDLSEFPSLQAPAKQLSTLRLESGNGLSGIPNNVSAFNLNSNAGPFPKNVTGNKTYSEVSNTNLTGQSKQENSPGFQISHEDFPALPGATKQSHSMSHPVLTSEIIAQVTPSPPEIKPGSIMMQPTKPPKASIILPTFPPSMCKDQFGMAGLLAFIRSKDSCPNLIKFALGMDLCDLGLNLQSKGNLHSTFQSPWADRPCGLHHLEQNVPPEYRKLHVRLNVSYMTQRIKKYGDDLLFWLYYNNIGTTIQLLAIHELKNRGWMYYIPEKIWITKALGKEAPKGPYGVYCWFDVANWKKSEREINFEPDKVEYCEQTKPHFGL